MKHKLHYCLLLILCSFFPCFVLLATLHQAQLLQAQPMPTENNLFSVEITTTIAPIDKGQPIPLTITLHNQRATALKNVTATLRLNGNIVETCALETPTELAPGSLRGYTCIADGTDRDLEIEATAYGVDDDGIRYQAIGQLFVDITAPQIAVDLSTENSMVLLNSPITYSVAVTNNGNFRLNYVGVLDSQVPDCALVEDQSRVLDVNETLRYSCVMTNVTTDFTHTVRAEASPPIGRFVFDEDQLFIDVITPALTIEKTPSFQSITRDSTASFVMKVTNVGDVPLRNIVISDSHSQNCSYDETGLLYPGEFIGYTCSVPVTMFDLETQSIVYATTPISTILQAQSVAEVDVQTPMINVTRTPADLLLSVGESAHFSVTVTNTGNADLVDITILDRTMSDCVGTFATLKQGESEVYSCVLANVTSSLTSTLWLTATATTSPWQGEVVTQQIQTHIRTAILATIGDLVWEDRNYNGLQDSNEPGIADVELHLYSNQETNPLYTTFSDSQGHYQFDKLLAGAYRLAIVLPPDAGITLSRQGADTQLDSDIDEVTGETLDFTVAAGVDISGLDIGLYYPAKLGGQVWYDSDLDGLLGEDEKGIGEIAITLYRDQQLVAETETDRTGNYFFKNLVPGTYQTAITQPEPHFRLSSLNNDSVTGSSSEFTLYSGDQISQTGRGLYELALVSGQIWEAVDYDGIRSNDDQSGTGVVARLYAVPSGKLLDVQSVNEEGRYTFSGIMPGSYYIHFQQPANTFWGSPVSQGNDDYFDNDVAANGRTATFQITKTTDLRTLDGALHPLPTSVTNPILNLRTTPLRDGMVIAWLAANDPLTQGYHLWRGQEGNVATRLTPAVIPMSLSGAVAQYDLLDITAQPDVAYTYWVEVIGLDGSRENSVPVSSAVDLNSPLHLWRVQMPIIFGK